MPSVVRALTVAAILLLFRSGAEAADVIGVSAGLDHTCAVIKGGALACWGSNRFYQLGDEDRNPGHSTPRAVLFGGVAAVATGYQHTCSLSVTGLVSCWGFPPATGYLVEYTPTRVYLGQKAIALTAGRYHTCALTSAGSVWCWGRNSSGQLGDGTTTDSNEYGPTPVVVGLPGPATAISAGELHTCAVAAGRAYCWGDNSSGQLGDGSATTRLTAVPVTGSLEIVAIAAGARHTCAVVVDGSPICWGANYAGQLGDGTLVDRRTPGPVAGLTGGITAVAANGEHACALTAAGGVMCWGQNGNGQLGDGSRAPRPVPGQVVGVASGVTAITAGYGHNCALYGTGDVSCWGRNSSGQVADSTTVDHLIPVHIDFPPTVFLDRNDLQFGATRTDTALTSQTPVQSVRLTQTAGTPVTWTAKANQPWLTVSPTSGSGPATLSIGVKFAPGLPDPGFAASGSVTVTAGGGANVGGPIGVFFVIYSASAPFGNFDAPAGDGTPLAVSVALGGWALDRIGVQRVEIWRDLQPGESTPPFTGSASDPRNGKVFVANAPQVSGARPDVEALFNWAPFKERAGWGYLLLTWGLFGQGNGSYRFYAYGVALDGTIASLGSKTLVVNNSTATKPFGSIDTPGIGGDAAGPNFGWALTPKVNGAATCKIQPNGVQVSIDSGPLQPVVYGDARSDVAGASPGFSNSATAGGHFIFDWSTLTNGAHTIGWLVTDDCGRADGIGSRFFNVTTGTNVLASPPGELRLTAEAGPSAPFRLKAEATERAISAIGPVVSAFRRNSGAVLLARGYGELPVIVAADDAGVRTIEVKQGERIELRLPRSFESAYQLGPGGEPRVLPVGSTWDEGRQTFSWQPAAAFLGSYDLVFLDATERITVRVVVRP